MAADATNPAGFVLTWQHDALKNEVRRVRENVERNSAAITSIERVDAVSAAEYVALVKTVDELKGTMNKLIWAVVGMSFTIAGSAIGIALAAGVAGH